jgi:hypothetical protein
MSALKLTTAVEFKPLAKFDKKSMKYVEDGWHHATLTMNGFVPSYDSRYNDLDYEESEIWYIVVTYGVRTPKYIDDYMDTDTTGMTDDEYYKFALEKYAKYKL